MTRDAVGRPMEILLVEDDLEDAGTTIDALRQGDVPCRISLVRDGEEAMDFLLRRDKFRRAPQPDVILLDLNLPKKSGREVLAELKADRRLARVPVVVLTGSRRPTADSAGRGPARGELSDQTGRLATIRRRRQAACARTCFPTWSCRRSGRLSRCTSKRVARRRRAQAPYRSTARNPDSSRHSCGRSCRRAVPP